MRILILHLSDMHIKDIKAFNSFQLDKIADALHVAETVDSLLIVVSGDVAFSGQRDQYQVAYRCITRIVSKYRKKYQYTGKYYVLCVPGNHDVDQSKNTRTSKDLQDIRKVNSYEKHLTTELGREYNFFNFAKGVGCFEPRGVYCQRILDLDGLKIEVNLINSGVFSILEEDKGLHYIPQYCVNELRSPTGADIVLTVMHHSPDWYTDAQKNTLEAAVYAKSSIVFYGHEHYIGNKTITHENNPFALIQAGGELCQNDDWTRSTFHIGVYESETMKYSQQKMVWNVQQRQYETTDAKETEMPSKPSLEYKIVITKEWNDRLHADSKHNISENFLDYFVFPRLQTEDFNGSMSKEYSEMSAFITEIIDKKRVLISGGYNSGKTSLLKALFFTLSENYTVIYCDIANFRGKKAERILKVCFTDIYGSNSSDYDRFIQTPKEKKVIIIDDIDLIRDESLDCFISQLGDSFEYFILASKQLIDLSLRDRMKVYLKASDSTFRYRIQPVFSDKRLELIRKLVSIKAEDKASVERITQTLADAISAQRRFISLDPDFIIRFVEYYCNNVNESSSDSGVFSKVFEANLTYALSPFQTSRLSVDKLFVLLSKIAYHIHFNKAYPLPERDIIRIIEQYNADYGASVNCSEAITAMCKAKILICDQANGYRFTNRNYLAYYVAREVNSQYNETGNDLDLQKILKCACFGINADILLFISYITDNIRVLRLMLHIANSLTADWIEFDFGDNLPEYLKLEKSHKVELLDSGTREKEAAETIENERSMVEEIQTVEIYDYSDTDADNIANQIIRACSLLVVVAKCLPNFEHNMLKDDKDEFVQTIYKLPNRIFGLWSHEADRSVSDIVRFFKEQSQDFYLRQKVVNEDDIIKAFQWISISLLLDLYNISAFYAAKESTHRYLTEYPYMETATYALEHLMILERIDNGTQFVEEALKTGDDSKTGAYKMAFSRIISHEIIFMKSLDYRFVQQLQARYFPHADDQKRLLAKRNMQNKKGEE